VRTPAAPLIDGDLSDAVWANAAVVDDLHQVTPVEYAMPDERTEVLILYDDDALYVAARLYDTDPDQITARNMRQNDNLGQDDRFYVTIDPFNDRRSGYFFGLNPNGVRADGLYRNVTEFYGDWDSIYDAAAGRFDGGWTAEIEIPYKSISFDPTTDTWGLNFSRTVVRKNEIIAWVSRNRAYNPAVSGLAVGFEGLKQGIGLEIVPSLAVSDRRSFVTGESDSDTKPSLDLAYRITPQLNGSLTINTDFSVTEVDDRQVNLTRLGLFFPEKRDFFLRDADIFEFGQLEDNGRPFFSRSIGLNRFGRPIDIDYGGKVSGHFGGLDLGSLYIRQGEDPETGVGARDLLVARMAKHMFEESSVGAILTHGDPHSEFDNTLTGVDFSLRNSRLAGGRAVRFDGWFQHSDSGDGVGAGEACGLALETSRPVGWFGSAAYKHIEDAFAPAMGFVNRSGIEDFTSEGGYRWRFGRDRKLSLVEVAGEYYQADTLADGELGSSLAGLHVSAGNQYGDLAWLGVYDTREQFHEDFTIYASRDGSRQVVIPAGSYEFLEGRAQLTANAARKVSGSVTLRGGEYYEGTHWAGEVELAWKPNRHLNLYVSQLQDHIRLPGGDFIVRLMSAGVTVAFDSHWSWTNVAQYDNVSEVLGVNSRLHWTPRAGRNAYLVVNHGRQGMGQGPDETSWLVALKYNHDLRF
ncbi:MAG TPA: carbohydrate binding family 9 domain-containing protein, partial [Vicinamibacterales bacterium]|nr:carbohydrate binding family 9 domain-containing protein [Vicinamibacterales bacterium]